VIDDHANHAITGEMGDQLVLWDLTKLKRAESPGDWTTGIWASSDKALVHQDAISLWDFFSGKRTEFHPGHHCEVAAAPSAEVWAIARWSSNGGGRIRVGKWGRKQTSPSFNRATCHEGCTPACIFRATGNGYSFIFTNLDVES
jgi:hypothetical protein